ncbi:TolC family protein [Stagnimonas aquatica]|uniref:TolC family protein n=1 Tax=Stagnimonas aquatica TaxID=2689987 RepID=A0A3N0VA84_9GAMM|nr:TolC family protein [Stagnimonas aquatica]ROH89697.1 TolC family protein [Stagnimonas aquatica]
MSQSFKRLRALLAAPFLLVSATAFADNATPIPSSPTLASYVDAVLRTHPELKVADASVAAAQAKADGLAQAIYNPELNADAQRSQSDAYSIGLSQSLDFSGKRSARTASGQKQLQQAVAERAALRQQLATGLLSALADYQAKQALLALVQQRLELLQRFSTIAEQQYAAGDNGILDRNLGQLALAEGIAIAGRAELELLEARRKLDTATGNSGLQPPSLPTALPSVAHLPTDFDALSKALPSVQAAQARQEAALAEVDIARSNSRADPTVGIRGGRETSDSEPGKTLVGLQLSIPLFVRNNFRAEQVAASASADAARLETAALTQQSIARMKATASQFRASYAAWERLSKASGTALDNGIELLDRVWKAREFSTAEYLVQLKQLLDGRAAGEELRYQTWQAWAEWLEASGQWREGLSELDATASASPATTPNSGNTP